jgi:preprotein translocase subunit SecG
MLLIGVVIMFVVVIVIVFVKNSKRKNVGNTGGDGGDDVVNALCNGLEIFRFTDLQRRIKCK